MGRYSRTTMLLVVALAAMLAASAARSSLVDDFNFTTPSMIEDSTANAVGVSGPRGTGGTLAAGWERDELYVNLVFGLRVEERDCTRCGVGHFNDDAASIGNGYESWHMRGGVANFSNTAWLLDYGVDVAGLDVVMYVYNSLTRAITGELWWKDIAATGMPGAPATLAGTFGNGTIGDYLFIEEYSVGATYDPSSAANYGGHLGARNFGAAAPAADFNLDNLRMPEPLTSLLVVAGLVSLAWMRRR